jgi:spore coat polysaccharide biosynthesis protein SpsF
MSSSRLPGKVLKTVCEKSLLRIHIERIREAKRIDDLIIATTREPSDDEIVNEGIKCGVKVSRGSLDNVLDRFYQAAKPLQPEWVVRLTADCPLVDPKLIDQVINKAINENADYCSNTLEATFPDGMDVEVFKYAALEKAWEQASSRSDREHVTPFIYRNSTYFSRDVFKAVNYSEGLDYGDVRLTVDEHLDFEVINAIVQRLGTKQDWKTYADFYLQSNIVRDLNSHIKRNEGFKN